MMIPPSDEVRREEARRRLEALAEWARGVLKAVGDVLRRWAEAVLRAFAPVLRRLACIASRIRRARRGVPIGWWAAMPPRILPSADPAGARSP